jgi:hypothetical protein
MTELRLLGREVAPRPQVVSVPFLGGHIPCFVMGDEPMVILKPIVEDVMGLSWPRQYAKLSADQTACVAFTAIQLPGDTQARQVMGVSLETFTLWLGGLQPSRVAPEARETVVRYRREAARALRNHFFGSRTEVARRPDGDLDMIQNMLDALRQQREAMRAQQQRMAVVEAKVSAIEGEHDWFTALAFAKLNDHPTNRPHLAKVGKKATALMRDRGEQPQRRQDATFGAINTYPADVLAQAFEAVTR